MLPSERLIAAFEGRKADAMPWFADLTYWYSAQVAMKMIPSKYEGQGRLNLFKDLGCGAHEELYGPVVTTRYGQVKTRTHEVPERDGGVTTYTIFETPLGELRKVERSSMVSYSKATIEYPVKTEKDLKILRFIVKDQKIEPSQEAYENQLRLTEMWDGWGIVSSLPPRTPFARLIIEWAGFMNVIRLQWRARAEFDETMQVMYEGDDPVYEAIRHAPAKFVYFGENLSSELISPNLFKTYFDSYYKKRSSQLHAKGKLIFVHIDGSLRGLLPLLARTGVDSAQSLTPAPFGDVKIQDLRKISGEGIVLWGGLPGVLFSNKYPTEILKQTLEEVIENYLEDYRFVIGVADQVPPDGEIERVRMVSDVVETKGRR